MSFWSTKSDTDPKKLSPVEQARASMRKLSERGVEIPAQVAMPIIEAEKAGDFKSAPSDVQHKFWSAYGALNSKIKSAEDAKDYYRRFFYAILAALLVLQLYYSASLAVQARLVEVGEKILAAQTNKAAAEALLVGKNLQRERASYLNFANYLMLGLSGSADFLNAVGTSKNPISTSEETPTQRQPEFIEQEAFAKVELGLATSFIGSFLLPVLYGMLGAIAFVLRRLSDDSLTGGESRELRNRFSLRVPIGALSGLAAGWLLQPPTSSTMTSLSPFALAFVAGYSADLVFTAMDRLVAAFTTASPPQSQEQLKPSGNGPAQEPEATRVEQPPASNADQSAAAAAPAPAETGSGEPTPSPRDREAAAPSSRAQANQDV